MDIIEQSTLVRTPIDFQFNPNLFEFNGSMTIELKLDDKHKISDEDILIALNNGEIRIILSKIIHLMINFISNNDLWK